MAHSAHADPKPPVAAEKPHPMEIHGEKRVDPYFWLRERDNPAVKKYLEDENAYVEATLAPAKGLREKLLGEMKARIKQSDATYPFLYHGYYYYQRFEAGKEYPIYARRHGQNAPEQILLDVNELARGHEYTSVPFPTVSPDSTKIVYAADFTGRRFYDLYVKDLDTGELVGEPIRQTTGEAEWASDSRTLFYVKQDPETLRARWVYRHDKKGESLVFEEKDETFSLSLSRAITEDYLFIASNATLSSEWRVLDPDHPTRAPYVFHPREKNHEYALEDGGDGFYVLTNWNARNFRVMKAPHRATKKKDWVEVRAHREDTLIEGMHFFRHYYVLSERKDGQILLEAVNRDTGEAKAIPFPDPAYEAHVGTNLSFDTDFLRYGYESLNRPLGVYEYSFRTGKSILRKEDEVPTYDSARYASERVWAPARDGARVPISLVYKKGFARDGHAPLLAYGYGAYGLSSGAHFQPEIVSLLDRGFVYAVLHVRGGSEMGRAWYENGRLEHKMNTFTDFIDATEFLVKEKYADPKRVYASGASAGGLLMGVVANLRPQLYRGIIAGVPFVDVLTTMLDDTIPLTTGEYDEWGNPHEAAAYKTMAAYSPYDNVKKQAYPNILITAGFHDSQVQYWEPAKWAAKLRAQKQGDSLVLLFTEMGAGHGGASGRFHALEQTALEEAFLLHLDGQKE